ncbi:MAG: hypothetical protein JXN65_01960 [Clostridia bacterium]|nr:hypothetical protein [Clostridia bacterium]
MKKILIIFMAVLIMLLAVSCEKQEEKITFSGTIIELSGDRAIIEPFDGEDILRSADKISVDISGSEVSFAVGDQVTIEYDGLVMESYPAQVNVMGIEKIG